MKKTTKELEHELSKLKAQQKDKLKKKSIEREIKKIKDDDNKALKIVKGVFGAINKLSKNIIKQK